MFSCVTWSVKPVNLCWDKFEFECECEFESEFDSQFEFEKNAENGLGPSTVGP